MTRSRFRVFFLLAALLLIAPTIATVGMDQVRAQDATPEPAAVVAPPPLAEAMPEDTAAYVATAFDPTSDQYLQLSSLLARLLIPGAGDTISAIVEQITQLLARIPSDLRTVLEGEIGVGVSGFGEQVDDQSGETASDPGAIIGSLLPSYAIVLHPIEAGTARELVEDWFADEVEKAGGTVERSVDGSLVVLRNPTINTADSAAPATVIFSGDYILLGTDYETLLPYVETTQGSASSLADSDDFDELNDALTGERLLFGYFDPAVLLDSAGDLEVATVEVSSIDPPVGPTAFTVAADDVGLRLESVSLPMTRLGNRRDSEGDNPDFATQVPDSTLAVFAGQDLGASWLMEQLQTILLTTLVGSMGGGDIDLTDFDIADQFGFLSMLTGINFKTDMFDQLTGDYGAALFTLDPNDPLGSSAVVASELSNPDIVSVAVTSLGPLIQSSGAGMASVTTASVDGQTVNNVTLDTDSIDATLQYGVVDDQLLIGLGDGIETVTSPSDATLGDSDAYQSALTQLPETYDGVIYADVEAIADQVAPLLLDSVASGSDNAILQCLAGSVESDAATPTAVDSLDLGGGSWIADTACSVVNSLLGGDSALLDLIVSRVPGPLAAVTYHEDGLQHLSGVLMVGSPD